MLIANMRERGTYGSKCHSISNHWHRKVTLRPIGFRFDRIVGCIDRGDNLMSDANDGRLLIVGAEYGRLLIVVAGHGRFFIVVASLGRGLGAR
jgi:hypothetical protein